MKLGAFSVSLAVRDIHKSVAFYKSLGFQAFGGDINQNWVMLKNESTVIGLFQGMFEKNILTFNPGWNQEGENIEEFDDVRAIEAHLGAQGITLSNKTTTSEGPGFITLEDPDGNHIMFDQHR
jgi:catechol 2,3-dioxygenase-like lactoylglutathione lyase family enzyme